MTRRARRATRADPGETIYRPKGCLQCRRMGYRGRVGVFEVVRITPKLTQLIQKRTPVDQLRKAAREEGMKMLFDSAIDKVRAGTDQPRGRAERHHGRGIVSRAACRLISSRQ